MRPLAIDPALLRPLLPDVLLRPGATVVARVAERGARLGLLILAGAPLTAELPEHVRPGDRLRLLVHEVSAERVVLKVLEKPEAERRPARPEGSQPARSDEPQAAGRPPDAAPAAALPLPGGARALIQVGEREGGGSGARGAAAVRVSFSSQALGRVDFRLALEGGAVSARVEMTDGPPAELGRTALEELRASLERSLGRPAHVRLHERRDPFDVYA
ncbi:MAG: hypothetical protein IRZ21_08835 [Thermoleophilaceae bacterium]|nr:hypothetical protein [Thermoleophilaceae bacterium]